MINLLRNREIRHYFLGLAALEAAGVGICLLISPVAAGITAIICGAMCALSIAFTGWRYRRLSCLADSLGKIAAGNYTIDLRDYADGELSVLESELHKVTSTLSHQAEVLQKDKAFLADAISDISHQLKTPLTSMSVMTELLETPGLPVEKQQEFVAGIRTGLDRMQWLIASLLKLSRLDAGAVEMRSDQVAMQALIQRALSPFRIAAEGKGLAVTVEGAEGIHFTGDEGWLAEAAGNLLKNCVEHTPENGSIHILCAQNSLYTTIKIRDSGPGIASEDLPHIFQRFYKGKNAGADSVGIGLALSKTIIQQQNGSIGATGDEGGTTFAIKLPR